MRWLHFYLLFTFFVSGLVKANDLNFSYSYEDQTNRSFNLELYELTQVFEEKNFKRLSAFPRGNLPFIHADEVMYSDYHKGSIFIKTGLLAPKNLRYKILTSPKFYLYHTDNASIAFFDFNLAEVKDLTAQLKFQNTTQINFLNMIVPTASASDVICQDEIKNSFRNIEDLNLTLTNSLLIKKIGECLLQVKNGSLTRVNSITDFFANLKNNPTQLWSEMKASYDYINFLRVNFSSELKSFFSAINGLTLDEQLDIACTLAGEMAPSLGMIITGAGILMGAGRLILNTIPKLQRLQRLMLQLKRYAIPYQTAKESLSCAI